MPTTGVQEHSTWFPSTMLRLVPGGGVEPPRSEDRRILRAWKLNTAGCVGLRLIASGADLDHVRINGNSFLCVLSAPGHGHNAVTTRVWGIRQSEGQYRPAPKVSKPSGRLNTMGMNITILSGKSLERGHFLISATLENQAEFALETHLEKFLHRNWQNIGFGSKLETCPLFR